MSAEADQLTDINRKQRERMLMLIKSRAQTMVNRPSPLSINRDIPYTLSH